MKLTRHYVTATDQAPAYLWMTASGRPAAPPKVQKNLKLINAMMKLVKIIIFSKNRNAFRHKAVKTSTMWVQFLTNYYQEIILNILFCRHVTCLINFPVFAKTQIDKKRDIGHLAGVNILSPSVIACWQNNETQSWHIIFFGHAKSVMDTRAKVHQKK